MNLYVSVCRRYCVAARKDIMKSAQRVFICCILWLAVVPVEAGAPEKSDPEAFADRVEPMLSRDYSEGRELLRQWFAAGSWKTADAVVTARLAMLAARPKIDGQFAGSVASEADLRELEQDWETAADTLSSRDLKHIALAFGHAGNTAASRRWGRRAFARLLEENAEANPPKPATLREAADILYRSFQCGRGKRHPEFVRLLTRCIDSDALRPAPADYERFAKVLGTKECLDAVGSAFAGARGETMLAAGKILSRANCEHDTHTEWHKTVTAQSAAAQETGNGTVPWLLLKAYSEALVPDHEEPTRRALWISEARKQAGTPADKCLVAREALEYFRGRNRRDLGDTFLEEMAKELNSTDRNCLRKDWSALWQ